MTSQPVSEVVDEIFGLYEQWGSEDYIGEPVSQVEHMCQAAQLAQKEGCDEEVILAAFFHDIGHLVEHVMPVEKMQGIGVKDHEKIAADYLKQKGFSERICKLVESHVAAKRYLTFKYPYYYKNLSEASRLTLAQQGGRMTEQEAELFEQDELSSLYIRLREWDDKAKQTDTPLPSLVYYKQLARKHLVR